MITDSERTLIRKAIDIIERETETESGTLQIRGFGTFKRVTTAPRTGRNPKTGEPVEVPARSVLKFKPSKRVAA